MPRGKSVPPPPDDDGRPASKPNKREPENKTREGEPESDGLICPFFLEDAGGCKNLSCSRKRPTPGYVKSHIFRVHYLRFACPVEGCPTISGEMDSIRRHITGAHKGEKREGIRRELDPEEQKKVEALEVKGLSWNEMYHIIYPEKAVAGGNEGSVAGGNEGSVAGGNEGSVASEREGSVARAEGICEDGDRTGGDYQAEVDWMHNWLLASENEGSVASEREGSVARAKSICEDGDRTSGDYQAEVDWMHNWLLAAPSNAIPGRLAPPTPTPSTYWAKIEGYVAGYTQTYYRSLRKRFKNAATIEDFRQVLGEVDRFYHDISDTASNASGEEG